MLGDERLDVWSRETTDPLGDPVQLDVHRAEIGADLVFEVAGVLGEQLTRRGFERLPAVETAVGVVRPDLDQMLSVSAEAEGRGWC